MPAVFSSSSVTETCGAETSANNTYFVNPEYPAEGRAVRSCLLTVHKTAPDVTQIRLDLAEFQVRLLGSDPRQNQP